MNESDRNCNEQSAEGIDSFQILPLFAKAVRQSRQSGPTTKAADPSHRIDEGYKKGYISYHLFETCDFV